MVVGDNETFVLTQNVQEYIDFLKKTKNTLEESLSRGVAKIYLVNSNILPEELSIISCDYLFIDNAERLSSKLVEEIAHMFMVGKCKKLILTTTPEVHRVISGTFHTINLYTYVFYNYRKDLE